MKKRFDDYIWIAGTNRTRSTLWEGPDHLLSIETNGFLANMTESYRRVDYTNIQTVGYAKTSKWIAFMILGVPVLALSIWMIFEGMKSERDLALSVVGLIIAVPVLLLLIINLAKGPTAVCRVQTAVQVLELKAVKRIKVAREVARRITELCMHHQQGIEIPEAGTVPPPVTRAAHLAAPILKGIKEPFTGSKLADWASVFMILAGAVLALDMVIKHVAWTYLDCTLACVAGTLALAAFARNLSYKMPGALFGGLLTGIINACLIGLTIYIGLIASTFSDVKERIKMGNNFTIDHNSFLKMSDAGFEDYPTFAWFVVGLGVVWIFCGLISLPAALAARRLRAVAQMPPALPPLPVQAPELAAEAVPETPPAPPTLPGA